MFIPKYTEDVIYHIIKNASLLTMWHFQEDEALNFFFF